MPDMNAGLGRWAVVVLAATLLQVSATASGSIKAGGGISPRDAYVQGKALTYGKLVCAGCPIARDALDRDRAASLKASLEARDEAVKPGTPDDGHIGVLERDEQEMVHYFLTRRFRL